MSAPSISRVLVANRGAIARRVIRACHAIGIETVAVFSEADAQAPHIDEATQAYPLAGFSASDSYLDQDQLFQIARQSGADAVHPGYGFLAENVEFAERVVAEDKIFIGPQARWLGLMGDKVSAREMMSAAGFPVLPGSALISDLDQAPAQALALGYPLMVKPVAGGGGMGMRVVASEAELLAAIGEATAIAKSAFASAGVYLEKWVSNPRHIEYQIVADNHGHAIHLFERDCSVQRRHQKLIEESPAPGIDPGQLLHIANQASQVCEQLGYNNVGTVETLMDTQGISGFLEMNTRIQVEHGVTEAVTGVDLVQMQIAMAQGEALPAQPERQGHALEVRLYAEDSLTQRPSTGLLTTFRPPRLQGVRIETGYREGQQVSPLYDGLLAKIIASGGSRHQAIGRAKVALKAFKVVGVSTNAELLDRILSHEEFLAGRVDTGMLARIIGVPSL